jgi:hypothetical protein
MIVYFRSILNIPPMWDKWNLDLTAHEDLLQVLGKFYRDIYLSQSGQD